MREPSNRLDASREAIRNRLVTLEDAIAEELALMILKGAYEPGEPLNQNRLAEMYGVSRIPVRAALRSLESQGLVTISRNGTVVAKQNEGELLEIYQVRDRLEPWLAARASLVAADEDIRRLSRILKEMEDVAELKLLGNWVELDREFHIGSYRPVFTSSIEQVIRTLWNSSQVIRRKYISLSDSLEIALASHCAFYEAYAKRDSVRVMQIEREHIRNTIRRLIVGGAEVFESMDHMEISPALPSDALQVQVSNQANGKGEHSIVIPPSSTDTLNDER